MRYPEVKGKVVDFIQVSAQTEGAFVNIRFTDKTDLGLILRHTLMQSAILRDMFMQLFERQGREKIIRRVTLKKLLQALDRQNSRPDFK